MLEVLLLVFSPREVYGFNLSLAVRESHFAVELNQKSEIHGRLKGRDAVDAGTNSQGYDGMRVLFVRM